MPTVIAVRSMLSDLPPMSEPPPSLELLAAFRLHYQRYNQAINEVVTNPTDEVVLLRLSDDLAEYAALVEEHRLIFPAEELETLQTNLGLMLNDVEIVYQQAIDASHHGRPTVVERVHTGRPGRPRVVIDPNFLQFAHEHRSTTGIGRFLNVSRGVVQAALLRQGLVEPGMAPFEDPLSENAELPEAPLGLEDDILDPDYAVPQVLPADVADATPPRHPRLVTSLQLQTGNLTASCSDCVHISAAR
ncbi:hypothetical protein B0H16DRAFT_1849759 [Mycena metata]|uniref:Uncharacterized protein n=1 Tax=Mycena metata TaxID=1033252 RepID=A0AAD7IRM2_9AGAR|nr:hypothetical protein B0H16DRAFT_1849759 [Mycena metata]